MSDSQPDRAEKVDLKIINGTVVTGSGRRNVGIAVDDGTIVAVADERHLPEARETIDADGNHIIPGVVDTEAHAGCYVPFKEDVVSETREAASVGVTTWGIQGPVTRMGSEPFQELPTGDDVVSFHDVMDDALNVVNNHSTIDTFFTYMLDSRQHAEEIPEYAEEWGVTSFKLYLHCQNTDDESWASRRAGLAHGFDDGMIYVTMENTADLGPPGMVCIHPENWDIGNVFEERLKEEGRTDVGAWSDRSPPFTEAHHVRSYAYLADQTDCPLFIQHCTAPETVDEVLEARGKGQEIYANIGGVWLYFDKHNGWRINTPLRDRERIDQMWEALADGHVDTVTSDHVASWEPNSREEMESDSIWDLKTGFTSRVQGLLPVLLSEGVNKGRISLERVVEIVCEKPAEIFGLYPKKGSIEVGADADLVMVDLDKEVNVSKDILFTRQGWSLLEGETLNGWPVKTILRGDVVADWSEDRETPWVTEDPGGQYQRRIPGQKLLTPLTDPRE